MGILLVEDDLKIASLIKKGLFLAGFTVDHAVDGDDVLQMTPSSLVFKSLCRDKRGIDTACVRSQSRADYCHDNLFHSMLGLMGVETESCDPELDIFVQCRSKEVRVSSIF